MFQQALCSALEVIINKALALNTQTLVLGELEQKTLTIVLDELKFPMSFICLVDTSLAENEEPTNRAKIMVTSLIERSDCTIKTSLATLKALQEQQQLTQLIKQDKLEIDGDIKVAQQFIQFAQSLKIDWLTELAKHIGDIPTFKLTRIAKKSLSKIKFVKEQIQYDAGEYLVHEQRLVITDRQLNAFYRDVLEVSKDVDLLEKRLTQIADTLSAQKITKKNQLEKTLKENNHS